MLINAARLHSSQIILLAHLRRIELIGMPFNDIELFRTQLFYIQQAFIFYFSLKMFWRSVYHPSQQNAHYFLYTFRLTYIFSLP